MCTAGAQIWTAECSWEHFSFGTRQHLNIHGFVNNRIVLELQELEPLSRALADVNVNPLKPEFVSFVKADLIYLLIWETAHSSSILELTKCCSYFENKQE